MTASVAAPPPAAIPIPFARITGEADILLARRRVQRLAELLGLPEPLPLRIAAAIAELARRAGGQAGDILDGDVSIGARLAGRILEFTLTLDGITGPELEATLAASGAGQHATQPTPCGRTRATIGWTIPSTADDADLARLIQATKADPPYADDRQLLRLFAELDDRQDELARLNQELQDTNRGVVALYAELDERADHLRRADELKTKFLSHMSHEFRTPLNAMLALSRMLLARSDGELGTEQERQVMFIRKAAENLTELVDDLLDLAKVEAGKIEVHAAPFTLDGLFGALRGMLRPLLSGEGVALQFDDPVDFPMLHTDEGKLAQILRNLISNALKFTERGEVRVSAAFDPLADMLSISVTDTGVGIRPEDVEIIFQEFGQVANPLQGRVKGTGLGLPLSRRLAELLGGDLTVQSTPGAGSSFTVTLPRCFPALRESAAGEPAEAPGVLIPEAGRLPVLLLSPSTRATDDASAAHSGVDEPGFWGNGFADSPFQVLQADTLGAFEHALRQFQDGPAGLAAILLDGNRLDEDGWRLMLRLKQNGGLEGIPVIVLDTGATIPPGVADAVLPRQGSPRLL